MTCEVCGVYSVCSDHEDAEEAVEENEAECDV
jgi:hypothetical protein